MKVLFYAKNGALTRAWCSDHATVTMSCYADGKSELQFSSEQPGYPMPVVVEHVAPMPTLAAGVAAMRQMSEHVMLADLRPFQSGSFEQEPT